MKTFLKLLAPFLIVFTVSITALSICSTTYAVNPAKEAQSGVNAAGNDKRDLKDAIRTVINVLLFIIGAVAVIMIIIGGLRYVISNGDSGQVTSAKNTILYAVVGLVVALLAYAIVNFVINTFIR